jgi:hypothetical protein
MAMRSTIKRGCVMLAALFMVIGIATSCGGKDHAASPVKSTEKPTLSEAEAPVMSEAEATDIATEAYVYAYPLVTMEYTRRGLTNVDVPEGTKAPMGQFARMRQYPDASFHTVTAPNADTLYTQAWFNVSKEPWIVTVPDMGGRYYLLPMLDGWTNVFASPGTRDTAGKAQTFAITGPGWRGTLPAGVTEFKSPTAMVWLLGRIYCTGAPEDYEDVHALQDQITAVPLSSFGKPYTPPPGQIDPSVDMKTAVRQQVNALSATAYFTLFASLLKKNPPTAHDAPMVAKLAKLGIVPGHDFDAAKLPPTVSAGLAKAPKLGQDNIDAWREDGVLAGDLNFTNGWRYTTKAGTYGTNYRQRAFVTAVGVGANLAEDAVYPTSEGPDVTQKYSGTTKYMMHFDKGQLPPVRGFWSLTMYNRDYFFVDNPLNRYTLSPRDPLKTNPDGSTDLYIQADSPGADKESNWLPAPKDRFTLMLRLYWPNTTKPSILDGTWHIPPVKEVP